jgi:mono/diheme cytochrome c family protein
MRNRIITLFAVLILLSGCGGLAGEPEIVSTEALPTITPTVPPDLGRPAQRANLINGAQIFGGEQGCWLCHGSEGKGNGPSTAAIQCPLIDFTAVDSSRSKALTAWFAIVTNGNNGGETCPMPPWKGRLNEQQRWDVTNYIYSLHYTPDQLVQGKTLWQENCAACHGDTGTGDGPNANGSARPVPNFSDPAYLIPHSDTDLWKTVTNGLGPLMPAFNDKLTDDQRWAVVGYMRSLNWEGDPAAIATTATPTPAPTIAPTAQIPDTATITVSGKITNGTKDATVPVDQPLILRVIDISSNPPREVQRLETNITADSSYTFANVPRHNAMIYVVTLPHGGILQTSTPVRLVSGGGPILDLPILIYEVTDDPAVIQIEREEIFYSPAGQSMAVQQGISLQNVSDHLFVTPRKTLAGNNISVELLLPADAQQITLSQDNAQQFVIGANGTTPAIQAVQPIFPGVAVPLLFSYILPSVSRIDYAVPTDYLIQSLTIFTPQTSGLVAQGQGLTPAQPLQLQDGIYSTYASHNPIRSGSIVRFSLVGPDQQNADRRNVLAVVLFVAGLAIAGTLLAILRLNQRSEAEPAMSAFDKLVQTIADLDTQFEQGKIPREKYDSERALLKAELAKSLEG